MGRKLLKVLSRFFHTFAILLLFFIQACSPDVAIKTSPDSIKGLINNEKDKAVLIIIYRTTCPHCRHELSDLPTVQEKLANAPIAYLGLSVDSSEKDLNSYVANYSLPFEPYLLDFSTASELYTGFSNAGINLPGGFGVPLLIILNKKHEQIHTLIGYQENDTLLEKISDGIAD